MWFKNDKRKSKELEYKTMEQGWIKMILKEELKDYAINYQHIKKLNKA